MENANYVDDVSGDLVDHDLRKRRENKFTRSHFLAWTPTIGIIQQRGWGAINLTNEFCRATLRALKQIVGDLFQIVSGRFCPAEFHLGAGLFLT